MPDSLRESAERRSLKILMTADAVGGVWQYTVDLVTGISEAGNEVMVAVLGPSPSPEQKAQLLDLSGVEVAEKNFALEWEDNPWRDVDASGEWLLDLDRQFGADLIHLNGYAHATLKWKKPVVVVAHSCVYSWWNNVLASSPGAEWSEYKRRVAAGLSACEVAVAPSRFMAAELHREYGITLGKTRVIYNFSTGKIPEIQDKQPSVLAAGRVWDRAKNFSVLGEIARSLRWPILLAGEDKGTQPANGVRFLGRIPYPELLRHMGRASIFVHPALYEPFGLAVLDAARSKCCLVLADTASMRELWGDAAVFVNPRRPEDWIFELNRLADDSALCNEMSNKAFSHSARYQKESSVREYRALYAELANRRKRKAEEAA